LVSGTLMTFAVITSLTFICSSPDTEIQNQRILDYE
jgi:hypothetical protein